MKKKERIHLKYSHFPVQEFENEDDDSWQISYLDIITIVLGFLIILLSVSQITKSEFSSLSSIFGRLADEAEFITTPIGNIQDELFELLQPEIDSGNLEIIRDLNDLRVRFKSDDLYASGEASLQAGSEALLDRVLIAMQQLQYNDFNIDVEGHTDNTPIASVAYPSNWELSTARAANVVKYFNDMGIPAKRLKASGYADSRPVIEYDSLGFPFAANKERNRRVVLRLYYSSDNLIEERLDEELALSEIQESLEGALPEISSIETLTPQNELVLADEPAMVTLIEQNRIEQAMQESANNTPDEEAETVQEQPSPPQPEPEEVAQEEVITTTPPETSQNTQPSVPQTDVNTSAMPSLLKVDARCQFSVQLGEYEALQNAFQRAVRVESNVSIPIQMTFNNQTYSVRSEVIASFSDALILQEQISSQLNDANVSIVHQCYNNTFNRPKPVKYLIQFGAFQNRSNGLNYTMQLLDEFGIQAYMNRVSDTYNVLTGPYSSRNEVLTQLQDFRTREVSSNLFIRHQPETAGDYDYAYQIQINSFSNEASAQNLANQVRSNTGINTRVEELVSGTYSVMTGQSVNWNETQQIFNRIRGSGLNTDPVVFFLEYIP